MDDITDPVIRNPQLFKIKLKIGEDAYKFLRVQKNLVKLYDVISFGATGSGLAASSMVASKFFAPSGALAALGIATASTPIGWVIAAGVISGGAYYGISNIFSKQKDGKVTVVPEFINTPLDLLAVGISNLLMPLALKMAFADSHFDDREREHIEEYFIDEWGYKVSFVKYQIERFEKEITTTSSETIINQFCEFIFANPDCNAEEIKKDIKQFLREIALSDGVVTEHEKIFISYVETLFDKHKPPTFVDHTKSTFSKGTSLAKTSLGALQMKSLATAKTLQEGAGILASKINIENISAAQESLLKSARGLTGKFKFTKDKNVK